MNSREYGTTSDAALRELTAKASPLPWRADLMKLYILAADGGMVADQNTRWDAEAPPNTVARIRGVGGGLPMEANCDLLVASVNVLPEHLDRIKALEEMLREVTPQATIDYAFMERSRALLKTTKP